MEPAWVGCMGEFSSPSHQLPPFPAQSDPFTASILGQRSLEVLLLTIPPFLIPDHIPSYASTPQPPVGRKSRGLVAVSGYRPTESAIHPPSPLVY